MNWSKERGEKFGCFNGFYVLNVLWVFIRKRCHGKYWLYNMELVWLCIYWTVYCHRFFDFLNYKWKLKFLMIIKESWKFGYSEILNFPLTERKWFSSVDNCSNYSAKIDPNIQRNENYHVIIKKKISSNWQSIRVKEKT